MIRKKRIKDKPGDPGKDKKNKNPYLLPSGGFDLIDEFVGIDFMPYESKKKRKKRGD